MTEWKPDLCIYHGDCEDGFGAAWAIWQRWPDCRFQAGHYGKPLPEADNLRVLFVDFSAPRAEIEAMARRAASIVIIDHHRTAEADLAPFAITLCGSALFSPHDVGFMLIDRIELGGLPVVAWFDMDQSGAAMAWQFANGTDRVSGPLPLFLEYIEDRDLWRFAFGGTRPFSAALRTYPMEFAVWDTLSRNVATLIQEGEIALRAHRANIRRIMAETHWLEISGHRVPAVNAPYHYASDIAHALLDEFPEAPFATAWFHRGDGQIQWSLRSENDRIDVSEIARLYGGGGHRNAAGFKTPLYTVAAAFAHADTGDAAT